MGSIDVPDDWRFMRVREELDGGRLWKARDRLTGRVQAEPWDQAILDVLGSVLFEMGDLPAAGRYWWLTERDDDRATAARDAFYERFGTRPAGVLAALPRPARPDRYPASVGERLGELVRAATADGYPWRDSRWHPGVPARVPPRPPRPLRETSLNALGVAALLLVVASLVVGFVTIGGVAVEQVGRWFN